MSHDIIRNICFHVHIPIPFQVPGKDYTEIIYQTMGIVRAVMNCIFVLSQNQILKSYCLRGSISWWDLERIIRVRFDHESETP